MRHRADGGLTLRRTSLFLALAGLVAALIGTGAFGPSAGAVQARTPSVPTATTTAPAPTTSAAPAPTTTTVPSAPVAGPGFWLATEDGTVTGYGAVQALGSLTAPVTEATVCMASTPDGKGYWLLGARGHLSSFGDAPSVGSADSTALAAPIVDMLSTPGNAGYWQVAPDGGVFNYGDAPFLGSAAAIDLNQPIVGMAATPDGKGYWLAAADGGIFNYGDAPFLGSAGATPLAQPIVGIASTPDGQGYWLVAADGGVFSFGDAPFLGSTGGRPLAAPIIGMARTPTGQGYWLAAEDGGVFNFGDAPFLGSLGGAAHQPVVALGAPGGAGACLGGSVPANLATPGPGGPAGEGQWAPAGHAVGSTAAVYTTLLRPSAGTAPVGVAWVDTDRTAMRLYAGAPSQPPGDYVNSSQVAVAGRGALVAAFNSGFEVTQSNGGWFSEGQTPIPLRNGAATLVIYANRTVRIGQWGRDVSMTPDVVSARQNLTLLVDGGQPASDIDNGYDWGAVLDGIGNTWRSGVGIDAYGHLVYVAGPGLYPADLAHVLITAGAVEAMELDINPMWPLFTTYTSAAGQPSGTNLLGGMYFGPGHFLAPYDRDFFAVFAR